MSRPDRYTQKEVIQALREEDAVLSRVAERLGCTPKTVKSYIDRYPKVKTARYRTNRDVRRRKRGLPPKDPDNPATPKPERPPEAPPEAPAAAPAPAGPPPPPGAPEAVSGAASGIEITVLPLPGEAEKTLAELTEKDIAYALQRSGGNPTGAAFELGVASASLRDRIGSSVWLRRLQVEIEERVLDMLISRLQAIAYGNEEKATRNSIFAITRFLETRGAHRGYAPRKVAITAADRRNIVHAVTWGVAIIESEELRHEVVKRVESRLAQEAEHNERWESDDGRGGENGNGNGSVNGAEE